MLNKAFIIFFILISCSGFSQITQDSLDNLLKGKSSKEKIVLLNNLAEEYLSKSPQNSLEYAKFALEISNETNDINGKINSSVNAGYALKKQKQYAESIKYFEIVLDIYSNAENKEGLAYCYNEKGSIYKSQGKFDNALEEYKKALIIYSEENKTKDESGMLSNIAGIYLEKKDYKKAGEYFLSAFEKIENSNDNKEKVIILNKAGACYGNWGNYDKALYYLEEALKLAEKYNYTSLVALVKDNIESIKYNMNNENKTKTDYEDEKGKLQDQYISEINEENYKIKRQNLKSLEEIEKLSFENQAKELKLIVLQDKYEKQLLENQIKEKNIQLLNAKIEINKTEIARKTEKIRTQKIIISLIIIGFVFLLLIIFFVFKTRQNRQKIRFKKDQIKAIIDAQEEERTRFARDVHDGIGQYFFTLKFTLSQYETDEINEAQKKDIYNAVIIIIDELQQEIRNISFAIMPSLLYSKGLIPALEGLIDKINKLGKARIDLDTFELNSRLDNKIEIALYRIIQELINNILKYAKAFRISIQFTRHEDVLNIMIEDDGLGYNTKVLDKSKGHGWKNINSRLEMINGNINIDSQHARKGTTVIMNIPIKLEECQK